MTRPFRILFACPQTLFDVSNGATMQCYTMLQTLSRMGFSTASIGGGIFDNPSGEARIPNFKQQMADNRKKAILVNIDSSANPQNPIRHFFFTGFAHTAWGSITSDEADKFLLEYTKLLRSYKPDIVIGFGCDTLCRSMWLEARLFGIPTAYIICNGNHLHYRFPLHNVLLCDSEATSRYYREREGLNVHPVGNFINPQIVVSPEHEPRYVTFINPCYAKGVGIVVRLIMMANKERPDIPFQIVETRQTFAEAARHLRAPGGAVGSAFKAPLTLKQISIRPASFDVKEIYKTTAVLLAPSLWYESWGRVATEAVMNGIPVLASSSGGLPEAVGTGGIILDAPSECGTTENRKAWLTLPSEESCRPWADALYKLYDERDSAFWQARCAQAAAQNSTEACAEKLLRAIGPLLEQRAGNGDFANRGSIRF